MQPVMMTRRERGPAIVIVVFALASLTTVLRLSQVLHQDHGNHDVAAPELNTAKDPESAEPDPTKAVAKKMRRRHSPHPPTHDAAKPLPHHHRKRHPHAQTLVPFPPFTTDRPVITPFPSAAATHHGSSMDPFSREAMQSQMDWESQMLGGLQGQFTTPRHHLATKASPNEEQEDSVTKNNASIDPNDAWREANEQLMKHITYNGTARTNFAILHYLPTIPRIAKLNYGKHYIPYRLLPGSLLSMKQHVAKHEASAMMIEGATSIPNTTTERPQLVTSGHRPTLRSKVMVSYRNRQVGKPFSPWHFRATFMVTGVIRGWTQILQNMCVAGKSDVLSPVWEVYIPWQLAYGARGKAGRIPPFTTLVFQMRLEGILNDAQTCTSSSAHGDDAVGESSGAKSKKSHHK